MLHLRRRCRQRQWWPAMPLLLQSLPMLRWHLRLSWQQSPLQSRLNRPTEPSRGLQRRQPLHLGWVILRLVKRALEIQYNLLVDAIYHILSFINEPSSGLDFRMADMLFEYFILSRLCLVYLKASIANATNIDTLLANKEGIDGIAVPPETLQDKVFFIFNNLSLSNIDQKVWFVQRRLYSKSDFIVEITFSF